MFEVTWTTSLQGTEWLKHTSLFRFLGEILDGHHCVRVSWKCLKENYHAYTKGVWFHSINVQRCGKYNFWSLAFQNCATHSTIVFWCLFINFCLTLWAGGKKKFKDYLKLFFCSCLSAVTANETQTDIPLRAEGKKESDKNVLQMNLTFFNQFNTFAKTVENCYWTIC